MARSRELVLRLGGRFRARGRAGRIQYATLGPKILELKPVADRLEPHDTAQVRTRGLDYPGDPRQGDVRRGSCPARPLHAGRPRLLGLGLTGEVDLEAGHLALRGVVAPFGNVTGALRRVPVVGRLFGARIVGVPFSVSGDWHDPRVTPLGPEAIAGSFVDLLGRALNAPIRLLSPLIPPGSARRERGGAAAGAPRPQGLAGTPPATMRRSVSTSKLKS